MEETKTEQIVRGIFEVIPVIMQSKRLMHNKLLESLEKSETKIRITETHVRILMILFRTKDLTMTVLGKLLMISKPNATTLVDDLVELKLVERISDSKDRRLVYIQLTQPGLEFIQNYRIMMGEETKKGLVLFTAEELDSYIDTLKKMKYFTSKLNSIYDKV
jgi:DNA-binding MarR family transcriptional regulator